MPPGVQEPMDAEAALLGVHRQPHLAGFTELMGLNSPESIKLAARATQHTLIRDECVAFVRSTELRCLTAGITEG